MMNTAPLIVSVGRLEKYKGHHRVIQAMPKVIEHIPDARLRIVGIGPYESTLRNMVKKLNVSEYVEIKGVPPGDGEGMVTVIAQASLVTLLSEHEAQGIVVLEALAQGRPVLVAATTALQDFLIRVSHGQFRLKVVRSGCTSYCHSNTRPPDTIRSKATNMG